VPSAGDATVVTARSTGDTTVVTAGSTGDTTVVTARPAGTDWAPAGGVSAPAPATYGGPGTYAQPAAGTYGQPAAGTYGQPAPGTYGAPPKGSASPGALLDKALADARNAGATVVSTVKAWPAKVRLAAAGGLAVVLLLGAVLLFSGSDDEQQTPPPQAAPSSTPAASEIETETHTGRGLSVNVPKGWKKNAPRGAVYVDFTDPDDPGRRVRILVERSATEPLTFLRQASDRLDRNSSTCADPYVEVGLREVELAGQPAAELEYTCGEGPKMRHGIWRAVTHDGKAYSFYLTTSEDQFAESKKYYDEMVRSFQFADAG
jgi:hypothetical protein